MPREYSGCAETLLILAQQHNMKEENILYRCAISIVAKCGDPGRSVEECYGLVRTEKWRKRGQTRLMMAAIDLRHFVQTMEALEQIGPAKCC